MNRRRWGRKRVSFTLILAKKTFRFANVQHKLASYTCLGSCVNTATISVDDTKVVAEKSIFDCGK
jgi:hypothetical protein